MNVKKKLVAMLLVCMMFMTVVACGNSGSGQAPAASDKAADTRVVKGDDGAEVTIPADVTRVAPLIGAFSQMTMMLTEGESKIAAAATNNISDYFKQVFPSYTKSNPDNRDAASVEDLIAAKVQVCYGPTSILSEEQRAQLKEAGIAYVQINNFKTVEEMSNAFLIIGDILGEKEAKRAQTFVELYQGNIEDCKKRTADLKDDDKMTFLSIFYSAGAYATTNGSDISNEYVESVGGINVAKAYSTGGKGNQLAVDAEQIVQWNPDFIMTSTQAGKEAVLADPALATVKAVQNGKVAVCPTGVYLWSVRSGEGALLPHWLGTQMYPEQFSDIDMSANVKTFFNDWYHYDISDAEVQNVLAGRA